MRLKDAFDVAIGEDMGVKSSQSISFLSSFVARRCAVESSCKVIMGTSATVSTLIVLQPFLSKRLRVLRKLS